MKLFVKDLLMMYNGSGTVVEFENSEHEKFSDLTEVGTYEGYVPFDGIYKLEMVYIF
jgi:hypothetical protein